MPAVRKAARQAGLTLDDIDLVELNEAFAAQVLACLAELPIDPDRLNVNGGAIALGHPLGCTGAKLTTSLLYEMRRRQARYGLVTMCVGGGMGAAGHLRTDVSSERSRVLDDDAAAASRGGAWLLEATAAGIFTPEQMTDEHRLIAQTTAEFAEQRCCRRSNALEQKDWALARALLQAMRRAGPAGRERAGGLRWRRARHGLLAHRLGAHRALGLVRRDVRRAGQSLHPADPDVRHRRPESSATCPASSPASSLAPTR